MTGVVVPFRQFVASVTVVVSVPKPRLVVQPELHFGPFKNRESAEKWFNCVSCGYVHVSPSNGERALIEGAGGLYNAPLERGRINNYTIEMLGFEVEELKPASEPMIIELLEPAVGASFWERILTNVEGHAEVVLSSLESPLRF